MTPPNRDRVVLAAGGTGGHVFPAQALAAELIGRGCRLALITDRRGDEFGNGEIEIHRVLAGGMMGKSLAGRLKSAPELAMGTWQARGLLKRLAPKAVIGFGGYASIPAMLAAGFGGYRAAIHEQNAILGRANRLLASRVVRIATSFQRIGGVPRQALEKCVFTGMPVRPAVTALRDRPYRPLTEEAPIDLLVLGGSQGARILSDVVPASLGLLPDGLRARLRVTQQCRAEDLDRTRRAYGDLGIAADLDRFFSDVPERLGRAHLLIARSGASTVAEATAVGVPSVLVPYPHAVDDHQSANAHAVAEAGGGWLIPDQGFNADKLASRLQSLFATPVILDKAAAAAHAMGRADAASRLADMVMDMIGGNGAAEARRAA